MTSGPHSAAGRDGDPNPPRPADHIELTCPTCKGHGSRLFDRSSGPPLSYPCPGCRGYKTIPLAWVSTTALPGVRHVIRTDVPLDGALCQMVLWAQDLVAPRGLYCVRCVAALRAAGYALELPTHHEKG